MNHTGDPASVRGRRSAALVVVVLALGALLTACPPPSTGTFMKGRVVSTSTGLPVAGVVVQPTSTDGVPLTDEPSGVTDVNGYFAISLVREEYGLQLDGLNVGHEVGFVSCPPRRTVATWGEACTFAPTELGPILIDAVP